MGSLVFAKDLESLEKYYLHHSNKESKKSIQFSMIFFLNS
jgi:hypothetical protein